MCLEKEEKEGLLIHCIEKANKRGTGGNVAKFMVSIA